MNKLKCGKCFKVGEALEDTPYVYYKCSYCSAKNEVTNVPVKEWIGFNFQLFLEAIKKFIDKDKFENLAADNIEEVKQGYLSEIQVKKLKNTLKDSFEKGNTINEIAVKLKSDVGIKGLTSEKGEVILDVDRRAVAIARSEITRTSVGGALEQYEQGDVEKVEFVASLGQRTCEICEGLNGTVYDINNAFDIIPIHVNCRCTMIPVVTG